jgi:THO complex subunit 2
MHTVGISADESSYSAGFFVTFWQLSLYDVLVPMARYQTEVERLNSIIREIDMALKSTIPSYPGQLVDKTLEGEKKRARERLLVQIQALNSDLKAHTEAYETTRKRLNVEKAHWFRTLIRFKLSLGTDVRFTVVELSGQHSMKEASAARRSAVQYFLQECLTPRSRLSPIDASYCARFVKVLHNCGTPNFPSLHVYDKASQGLLQTRSEYTDANYRLSATIYRRSSSPAQKARPEITPASYTTACQTLLPGTRMSLSMPSRRLATTSPGFRKYGALANPERRSQNQTI